MGARGPAPVPVEQRFWTKVDQSGGPDACWPWTASTNASGYGRVGIRGQRVDLAHRVAWSLAHPSSPLPEVVRHTCDNPPCCNPAHLLEGTQWDNVGDMDARGRRRVGVGERHGRAVITEDQAGRFKGWRTTGVNIGEAAARVGITLSQAREISAGRTWRHVTPIAP